MGTWENRKARGHGRIKELVSNVKVFYVDVQNVCTCESRILDKMLALLYTDFAFLFKENNFEKAIRKKKPTLNIHSNRFVKNLQNHLHDRRKLVKCFKIVISLYVLTDF
ncbi:hypothetical protein KUTeg_002066 [Tegillarca granosa]|uniref:Uncharacterized protein n=1 Tax=Tegillarca granosa TaxID=220873 RepID=A0ABQ9FT91_TEGGR|nr:hypothetical protein KUTeg_002066 [Tegillarca granosa]